MGSPSVAVQYGYSAWSSRVATDAVTREKVQSLPESDSMVRAAFNHALFESLPEPPAVIAGSHAGRRADMRRQRWLPRLAKTAEVQGIRSLRLG